MSYSFCRGTSEFRGNSWEDTLKISLQLVRESRNREENYRNCLQNGDVTCDEYVMDVTCDAFSCVEGSFKASPPKQTSPEVATATCHGDRQRPRPLLWPSLPGPGPDGSNAAEAGLGHSNSFQFLESMIIKATSFVGFPEKLRALQSDHRILFFGLRWALPSSWLG